MEICCRQDIDSAFLTCSWSAVNSSVATFQAPFSNFSGKWSISRGGEGKKLISGEIESCHWGISEVVSSLCVDKFC